MGIDQEQFDELAKTLAHGVSRRQVLKLLGAAALAVIGLSPEISLARDNTAQGPAEDQAQSHNDDSICPHRGRTKVYKGSCCPDNGSCEAKGHVTGVSCTHGHFCSVSETCCESLRPDGSYAEMCCEANETCEQIHHADGSYTGTCRPATPWL